MFLWYQFWRLAPNSIQRGQIVLLKFSDDPEIVVHNNKVYYTWGPCCESAYSIIGGNPPTRPRRSHIHGMEYGEWLGCLHLRLDNKLRARGCVSTLSSIAAEYVPGIDPETGADIEGGVG